MENNLHDVPGRVTLGQLGQCWQDRVRVPNRTCRGRTTTAMSRRKIIQIGLGFAAGPRKLFRVGFRVRFVGLFLGRFDDVFDALRTSSTTGTGYHSLGAGVINIFKCS